MIHFTGNQHIRRLVLSALAEKGVVIDVVRRRGDDIILTPRAGQGKSDSEIQTLVDSITASLKTRGASTYDPANLRTMTPQQLDDYIVSNVTDLASAKLLLRRMAKLLLYLYKREIEEI